MSPKSNASISSFNSVQKDKNDVFSIEHTQALVEELDKHQPMYYFRFWSLYLYRLSGSWMIFSLYNMCCKRPSEKYKPDRYVWCLAKCYRNYYKFSKGVEKMESEVDILKLIKRVRMHNLALKSSILCSKDRRNMLKNT